MKTLICLRRDQVFSIQGLILSFMFGILMTLFVDLILETIRDYRRFKKEEELRRML